jgi:hypothetical protein
MENYRQLTEKKKDELEIIVCNKFINKLVKQYN